MRWGRVVCVLLAATALLLSTAASCASSWWDQIAGTDPAVRAVVADRPTYAPAVVPSPGGHTVVYRTARGTVALRTVSVRGAAATWSRPSDLGGATVGGPAATYAAGSLHVFARGPGGRIWERIRDGRWGAWTEVDGLTVSSAPAAVGRPDGRIDLFARDATDRLRHRTYEPGDGWGPWRSLGGHLRTAPAAVLTGPDTLRVVATREDSAVWTRTLAGDVWSEWASLGGRTYSAPAVSAESGRVRVFLRDARSDALRVRTHAGSWSSWQVIGGPYVDGPGAAGGDQAFVVGRGRDDALYAWTGRGARWSPYGPAWTPAPPPAPPKALRGRELGGLPAGGKTVVLTIDCTWSAAGLEEIRETLQRENVPATFFLAGDFPRAFPEETNALVSSGFTFGNHGDRHLDLTKTDDAKARTEVTGGRAAAHAVSGVETRPFFRFPYGASAPADVRLVNGLGYLAVGWTRDTLGWKGTSGGETPARVVTRATAKPTPGMILQLHAGAHDDDKSTLDTDALPAIIDTLKAKGYTFVPLTTALS